jgi:phosphoglycolate phosphatase
MKRLAVFDVDGTLVDSRRSISDAVSEAWRALDLPAPSYEETRHIVGLNLLDAVRTLAPSLAPARYPELAEAYRQAFLRNRAAGHHEPLYDGAVEALRTLKDEGWALGVATGKARRGLDFILDHHALREFFDAAFCADDGPGKPHPHMLELNMRALGFDPAFTAMIGDTSHDMQMARAAGVYAVGVDWGFHTAAEIGAGGAHEVVSDFATLNQSLSRWRSVQQAQQQQ